jgi:UDP-N-acetylmuramoyl-tripeptide--D-alanyl-D-alanine ligase
MEPRSIAFLVEACGGRLAQGAGAGWFHGVSTDSRHFVSGQAFVALSGDRHDGHGFLLDVARSGAAALVVEEGKPVSAQVAECAVVRVPDTRAALGRLAGVWRRELTLPVIAVAGSNGKTTTKEMLGSVLSQRYRTVRSRASYNNDVGVPLTLLTLDREHEVAVVEAGTNHPGELAPLLEIIRPGLGVLTSIGREHLEHFGTLEAVAREEGALAAALPEDGCLFIDGDTPLAGEVTGRTRASVVRVGFGSGNDWRAEIRQVGLDGVTFWVSGPLTSFGGEFHLPFLGRHQVTNALLAVAVAARLGVEPDAVRRGLAACPALPHRMEVRVMGGVCVLDDAYNANADSVLAALRTLREIPCAGRRIAVLGEMAETGVHAPALHAEVGRLAASLAVDLLFAVGRMALVTGEAARQAGLGEVRELDDAEAAAELLARTVRPGDVILVKASRRARLERISETLCPRAKAA